MLLLLAASKLISRTLIVVFRGFMKIIQIFLTCFLIVTVIVAYRYKETIAKFSRGYSGHFYELNNKDVDAVRNFIAFYKSALADQGRRSAKQIDNDVNVMKKAIHNNQVAVCCSYNLLNGQKGYIAIDLKQGCCFAFYITYFQQSSFDFNMQLHEYLETAEKICRQHRLKSIIFPEFNMRYLGNTINQVLIDRGYCKLQGFEKLLSFVGSHMSLYQYDFNIASAWHKKLKTA